MSCQENGLLYRSVQSLPIHGFVVCDLEIDYKDDFCVAIQSKEETQQFLAEKENVDSDRHAYHETTI